MISQMAKALASVGPNPSYGFGPGVKSGVSSKEGGPGSGPSSSGDASHSDSHRGARIYQSGKSVRAITPTGHNIGPYKNADLLKSHLDKFSNDFGLAPKKEGGPGSGPRKSGEERPSANDISFGAPKPIGKAPSMRTPPPDHKKGADSIGQTVQVTRGVHNGGKGKVSDYEPSTGMATVDFGGKYNSKVKVNIGHLKTISRKQYDHNDDYDESDSATTQTAQLKTPKESVKPIKKLFEFREANTESFKNHKFEVVIIKEGLGNFKDRFFYSKGSLQLAAQKKIFEGSQCFADHPSEIEEQSRPERSTRDILGYYENVRYQENGSGQGVLVADLVVSDSISLDWATALLTNSIEYSKKFQEADLVGLSINASGAAEPVGIDKFMSSQSLPDVIVSKLNEAKAQGVEEINVVNELKEAQSVDLVTKAGAGGRILQMLEQEKRMSKKKLNGYLTFKENEDGAPAAGDGATPDHEDADQDKALFAQMIKQYLGKDDATAEEMEMAQHAHEACKEMGMENKEAYEAAGSHLKMAMAVGKKMAQKQAESKEKSEEGMESHESESEESEEDDKKEGQTPPPNPKEMFGKKESMKSIIELNGKVAKLTESLKRYETRDYLDKKLSESGKSNTVTKKFREALGVPRSKEQIDATWRIFIKAYEAGAEEVGSDFSEGFLTEKQTYRESSAASQRNSGFSDCMR